MSDSLFDSIDRTLEGGAPELLSQFDYLNMSNRAEAERVRALIDDFLSRFPERGRRTLQERLRSIDDVAHCSAFFELVLHEFLIRSGCRIKGIEPSIGGTKKSPDFLVEMPSGEAFYLEATLATGRSSEDAGAQKRLDQVFKTLNSIHSSEFFLAISHRGMPQQPIAGRKLKAKVARWLNGISYEAVVAAYDGERNDAPPVLVHKEHGLRLTISPVPRRGSRGTDMPGRAIASRTLNPLTIQPQAPICDAVKGKASRYGQLDRPYLVAVNAMSAYADEVSAIDALFGSPGVEARHTRDGRVMEREIRAPDGAWHDGFKPINTRVSAVLSTERLRPWSVGQTRARLILNPWAQKPLPDVPFAIDTWKLDREFFRKSRGASFSEIFELPYVWPE